MHLNWRMICGTLANMSRVSEEASGIHKHSPFYGDSDSLASASIAVVALLNSGLTTTCDYPDAIPFNVHKAPTHVLTLSVSRKHVIEECTLEKKRTSMHSGGGIIPTESGELHKERDRSWLLISQTDLSTWEIE